MAPTTDAHFFYVLWCADDTFYAGYTTDVDRRVAEHNRGVGAKYTRPATRRPQQVIYTEIFETKSEAMQREAAFKQLTRPQKIDELARFGVTAPVTAPRWRRKEKASDKR